MNSASINLNDYCINHVFFSKLCLTWANFKFNWLKYNIFYYYTSTYCHNPNPWNMNLDA